MCNSILQPVTRALGMQPKMPTMPALPPGLTNPRIAAPPPGEVDGAAQMAERSRARAARGRAATILTGGQGDASAPVLQRPVASAARALLG